MSVATKMTAIADKIRNLLGITGAMGLDSMASNLGEVETEVDNQAELIGEILSALDNKVAGSGGGGVEIETCTMTFPQYDYASDLFSSTSTLFVSVLSPTDGCIVSQSYNLLDLCLKGRSIESVVKNTLIYDIAHGIRGTLDHSDNDLIQINDTGVYTILNDVAFVYSDDIPM